MTSSLLERSLPALEALEDRLTPSSFISNGDLHVVGTDARDVITVTYEVHSGYGYYRVNENGVNTWWLGKHVWDSRVYLYGHGGDDTLRNDTNLFTTAYGGDGADALYGSWRDDYLDGGNDLDTVYGYGGNDTLVAGYDYSYNLLYGGAGDDVLRGGLGGDLLRGEADDDVLYGNAGDDYLYGGSGGDRIYGGYGRDWLMGEAGTDYLYGEGDDDRLYGGDEFLNDGVWDFLSGGSGRDGYHRDFVRGPGYEWVQLDTFGGFDAVVDYYL